MDRFQLILPLALPLLAIILSLISIRKLKFRQIVGAVSTAAQLAVAIWIITTVDREGIVVMQAGNWPAPFGITLVADMFSAIMLVFSGLIGFTVTIYSIAFVDRNRQRFHYYLLCNALLLGVNGAFLTGDVFNLYVWFEMLLISSFVLITLGSERKQLEGAIKYVTINLVASMIFLAAAGLLYGKTGTLNMADLAYKLANNPTPVINSSAMLFLVAFGIKAAVFPFFFWLPASYHTPPVAVTALFAGLLTKVGVYAMIRFFVLFFNHDQVWKEIFLVLGTLTMVIGAITAASQYDIRRILSFHIISQIGYMIIGLGFFTPLAIAGAIYFMGHNIVAKTNTFLIGGIIQRLRGSYDLKSIGGLYQSHPFTALLFIVPALSLAGVPPLSGFFGKFVLIKAGYDSGNFGVASIALLVGLVTLFSMIKIWNEAFWKKEPQQASIQPVPLVSHKKVLLYTPVVILAVLTIVMGIFAGYFFRFATVAAEQLTDPSAYIRAVLGI